ncbi:MAG: flagellar FlbD family protein [Planctomycetota bacterium]
MIPLTRLNGKAFFLNSELIKFVEETPDTVITLISGERLVVSEKISNVVDRVVDYGRRLRVFPRE